VIEQYLCRPTDYMEKQHELNENVRAVAVGWMVKVHHKCALWPETLYLAVSIIDRYLSSELIPRHQLPLVMICGLLIASKYEENLPLGVCNNIV
jgi:Cyclin, N-terminal domain